MRKQYVYHFNVHVKKGISIMCFISQWVRRLTLIGIPGLLLILLLSACGGTGGSTNSTDTSSTPSTGGAKSIPATTAGKITEFSVTSGSNLYGITAGPDGNLWFIEA